MLTLIAVRLVEKNAPTYPQKNAVLTLLTNAVPTPNAPYAYCQHPAAAPPPGSQQEHPHVVQVSTRNAVLPR